MTEKNKKDVLDIIKTLCNELSQENITVQQVGDSLGTVLKENSTKLQLNIRPAKPVLEEVVIVRESEGQDSPSYVELKLGDKSQISLASLENTFGTSRSVPRTAHQTGRRIAITSDIAGRPYTCTIFANLSEDGKKVTQLTIRRDIRLPD